jgi:hypothetical protein
VGRVRELAVVALRRHAFTTSHQPPVSRAVRRSNCALHLWSGGASVHRDWKRRLFQLRPTCGATARRRAAARQRVLSLAHARNSRHTAAAATKSRSPRKLRRLAGPVNNREEREGTKETKERTKTKGGGS